ncbi:YfcE family phosphodiesterase [Aeoliella mucimassa]|uniref:Phosphoesterase n=1 Tax=Aeoliella mucimassa TaxID=2527972 RepID=A0A518ALE8_9BACT|nr:YfcE family phosphodiesterase [Aeoliella mucimassa]QDU55555.1 phosphodiesterase [Aeoliella mucimassa]
MLIGVVSDTHDQLERTRQAIDLLIGLEAELLVHCGDITSRAIVEICAELPLYFVFGNHDSDNVPELVQAADDYSACSLAWGGMIQAAGREIGVAHGHLRSDLRPIIESQPDYLLTGHFHEHADWMQGDIRRVCPGALHRADPFTLATIDLTRDEVRFHQLN